MPSRLTPTVANLINLVSALFQLLRGHSGTWKKLLRGPSSQLCGFIFKLYYLTFVLRVFGGGATVNPNAWVWRPYCTASLFCLGTLFCQVCPPLPATCISVHTCVVSNIRGCRKVCNAQYARVAGGREGWCLVRWARLLPARLYSCTRLDTAGKIGTDRAAYGLYNHLDPKQ